MIACLIWIKFLARLRSGSSHFREAIFKLSFRDTIDPLCLCSLEVTWTSHFFLCCQNFADLGKSFINELIKTDLCILTLVKKFFPKLLLNLNGKYGNKSNTSNILASIQFISSSKRFDGQLVGWFHFLSYYITKLDNEVFVLLCK